MKCDCRQQSMWLGLLIQRSVSLLQHHEPPGGYIFADSGGKDSGVARWLLRLANVKYEGHYHNTTRDPPEVVHHIRKYHPETVIDRPKHGNMMRRFREKAVIPTRMARWCCNEYKDGMTKTGDVVVLGIRVSESPSRAKNWTSCVAEHTRSGARAVLPIRLWDDADLWSFIHLHNVPYCKLYDEGFTRLGCIGCPLASRRVREMQFARWPRAEMEWRAGFEATWSVRAGTTDKNGDEWYGSACFDSVDELWEWWMDEQRPITPWRRKHGLRIKREPPLQYQHEGSQMDLPFIVAASE